MKINHKIIKRVAIWSILLLQATGFFYDNIAQAWSYPLKEIAKPTCKQDHWSTLGADCKIPLPVIAKANYDLYKDNQLIRLVYTVLRGGTYSDGRDMQHGAHEGVDIISSEGTPIYAIEDGEVIKARATAGYGNLITIKHTLANGSNVQSIYGHLESILVKEGSKVVEGQQIGTMGHEGNARGNHLHFAINTTKDNTYYLYGCLDYPKTTDYDIVEKGLCRDLLFSRTVDPIAFIEANGLVPPAVTLTTSTVLSRYNSRTNKKPLIALPPTLEAVKPIQVTTTVIKPFINIIPIIPTPLKSVTSISSNTSSNDSFLKNRKIEAISNFGTSLKKGGSSTIAIVIKDTNGKKFTGILDKEISITPSKQNVILSPRVIRYVTDGQVISIIEAKDIGPSDLVISYGDTVIGKLVVNIQ